MRGNLKNSTTPWQTKVISPYVDVKVSSSANKLKDESTMTRNEFIIELERMLKNAPDLMTPLKVSKCTPLGKNRVYELIKSGEIRSIIFQNSYIIAKADIIEYLADHAHDKNRRHFALTDKQGSESK